MNWVIAGLIAGVIAYLVDWVMWSKVFTKGMDAFAAPMTPEEMKRFMGPAMAKSAILSLVFGVVLAYVYARLRASLWVEGGGVLAGMEFATILWIPICLATVGAGVWYVRAKPLLNATCWAWLARMNAAGIAVGLLMK